MADLKTQLSTYITEVVDRVEVDDVISQEVVELRSPAGRLRSNIRPVWIVIAALVFVFGVVGLVPLIVDSSAPPQATLDPVATTTPPALPGNEEGAFYPDIDVVDGRASVEVTFPDGTTASASWPRDLELAESGVFVEAAVFTLIPGGADGRVLAIHRGTFEQIAESFGGGSLLAEYPGAGGSLVEFWRFPTFEWDYLVYQFDGWVVMVYDYRELAEERMTEEERSVWARSLTGHETPNGFLILDAAEPLRIGGPDFSSPPAITLRSPDGGVRLEATPCELSSQADSWCDPSGQIRISTPGAATEFESLVRDNLEVDTELSAPDQGTPSVIQGVWSLASFDGIEVEKGVNTAQIPWIDISDTTFEGNLGCNYFSAAPQDGAPGYRIDGDTLYPAQVFQNAAGCEPSQTEEAFGGVFERGGIKVVVKGDHMTWWGNGTQLEFVRTAERPSGG